MNHSIKIGGKERPVNFGRNFWAEVESISGKTIIDLLDINELRSMRNQIAIAFSALKWGLYDPKNGIEPSTDFTKNQVADWIDENPGSMPEFYKFLTESLPKKKESEEVQK